MAFKSKFRSKKPAIDVYTVVTDQIVKLLETGVRPWSRSWGGGSDIAVRPLRFNGIPYRGINVLILWGAAQANGYTSPYWMSFNQAKELGGCVRKGEHSTIICKPRPYTYIANAGTPDEEERTGNNFTAFPIFNADQIDGLPAKYVAVASVVEKPATKERIPQVEAYFDALPVKLSHGGNKAFYVVSQDRVQMPAFEDFFTAEAYYTTKAHEYVHWTRHETRLNRNFEQKKWGDEGYALEELVAELGAAYAAADLGLENHPREDHASYIAHWLKVLKNDNHAIFTAASHAEKAITYLNEIVNPTVVLASDESDEEVQERIAA